ncbi:MAG: bifunctional diaminohydroxyphosphoribosylaminopyrimidine deaminase/5-amino-6-(5-phosphoribosylamino)uracil reductase RibD [Pseudomonadales bacterium]
MMAPTDVVFMAQALRLAEKGRYSTHPNPRVGCVIVKDDRVVGRGFHLKAGDGHAEANALAEAGNAARGSTVYCTLEPCSFHGRTPSCAESLATAGVARVVAAMVDPDPRNAGKGLDILRCAGIEVDYPLLAPSAAALNRGHVKRHKTGLPYVRLKLAMSLDGKTALENGQSKWITGGAARRDVQKLRAMSAALVTGVQTVNDDDPSLTVRADELEVEYASVSAEVARPIFILDPGARINPGARILDNPDTVLVCLPGTETELSCQRVSVPDDGSGRIHLLALLKLLAAREYSEILIECGASLAGQMVAQGLVDELIVYAAPSFLGADARSLLNIEKIDNMHDRIVIGIQDVRQIGEDIRITCVPQITQETVG